MSVEICLQANVPGSESIRERTRPESHVLDSARVRADRQRGPVSRRTAQLLTSHVPI